MEIKDELVQKIVTYLEAKPLKETYVIYSDLILAIKACEADRKKVKLERPSITQGDR